MSALLDLDSTTYEIVRSGGLHDMARESASDYVARRKKHMGVVLLVIGSVRAVPASWLATRATAECVNGMRVMERIA